MVQSPFTVSNGSSLLKGIHHFPKVPFAPYVISAHGMMSTKDSPKYLTLGEKLVEKGFGFVRFDFTGCGESSGGFEDSTMTRRIDDLIRVIDWVRTLETCNGTIGLFGSSMGGTVALAAGTLRVVGAWVLLATPVKHAAHPPEELRDVMNRYPGFFDDFRANLDTFPFEKIHHTLVIHGDGDQVVSPENAFLIYERISPPKELWMVPGADHQFLDESKRAAALDLAARWFHRFLMPV